MDAPPADHSGAGLRLVARARGRMGVDLLAEHPDGAALFFWRLTRDQALAVIEQIHRALADGAAPGRGEG